jgi:HlyD family secretion protein
MTEPTEKATTPSAAAAPKVGRTVRELPRLEGGLRRRITAVAIVVMALGVGIFGWAAHATLSSAVIALGLVVVDSSAKMIQHPTGGVVAAINVKNGDRVSAGDVLIRLDDTQTRANLGIITSQIVQLVGRKARLVAERDGANGVVFPPAYLDSHPEARIVADGEVKLFMDRLSQRLGQIAQLRARIGQLNQEIDGLTAQRLAKDKEISLLEEELARVRDMFQRNLLPQTRLLQTERDLARLYGERGLLIAQIAKAGGQISETELQIIGIRQSLQSDTGKEIRDIEARIAELEERRTAAEDMLKRIDIRAPQSGIVHELAVHTVGGVVGPGETVMQIVPVEDLLSIEVHIVPTDIDQAIVGRKAVLHFPGLNRQTTPEIHGTLQRVSADLTREQHTGAAYYTGRVKIDADDLAKLDAIKLIPGMPVEAFIEGSERTALSYLVKPVKDQIDRAFREE